MVKFTRLNYNQFLENNNLECSSNLIRKLIFNHNFCKIVGKEQSVFKDSRQTVFVLHRNRFIVRKFCYTFRERCYLRAPFEFDGRRKRIESIYTRVGYISKSSRLKLFKSFRFSRFISLFDKKKFFSKKVRKVNFIEFFSSIFGLGYTRCLFFSSVFGLSKSLNLFCVPSVKISHLINYIKKKVILERLCRRDILSNLEEKKKVGSYVAVRISQGLPSRGQRTKTNARTSKSKKFLTSIMGGVVRFSTFMKSPKPKLSHHVRKQQREVVKKKGHNKKNKNLLIAMGSNRIENYYETSKISSFNSVVVRRSFYKFIYFKTGAISSFCTRFGQPLNFYGCADPVEVSQPIGKKLSSVAYYLRNRKFTYSFFNFVSKKKRKKYQNEYYQLRKDRRKKKFIPFFPPKEVKRPPLYYLIFSKKKNNYFICLLNARTRRLIKYFSAGLVGFTGPKRSSPKAAFETAAAMSKYISTKFKKKNSNCFIFVLKTPPTKELFEMFSAISKFVPWIDKRTLAVFTNFTVYHGGGLRPKKQRRL